MKLVDKVDRSTVGKLKGDWIIDKKSKVFSLVHQKDVYEANAMNYPEENQWPSIVVDGDYNFICHSIDEIND